MDFGDMMIAAGAVRAERNATQNAINAGIRNAERVAAEITAAFVKERNALVAQHQDVMDRDCALVHIYRTMLAARKCVEAKMAEVIAELDPGNPLASVEHIGKLVQEKTVDKIYDPEIIAYTYANGVIRNAERWISIEENESGKYVNLLDDEQRARRQAEQQAKWRAEQRAAAERLYGEKFARISPAVLTGYRVRVARVAAGWPPAEVAKESRGMIDRQSLSEIESGIRTLSEDQAMLIGSLLGKDHQFFLNPTPSESEVKFFFNLFDQEDSGEASKQRHQG